MSLPLRSAVAALLAVFAAASALPAGAQAPGGVFVAIGGGAERPEIVDALVRLTGGKDRKVIVLPTASSDPSASGLAYKQYFQDAGLTDVESLALPNRESANDLEPVKDIGRADLLYFTGGDQNRLVSLLANTAVHGSIQTAVQRQAVLAGTSAGAMVWGSEFISGGDSRRALLYGFSRDDKGQAGLELRPGLNLWDNLIIDTHFTERMRLGRLVLACASTPGTTGLGVDEGTAAIITPDSIQAVGVGAVTVVESDKLTFNNAPTVGPGTPLAVGNVSMHRLLPGKIYLRKWKAVQEEHPLAAADTQPPRSPYMVLAGSDVPRKELAPIADFVRAAGGSTARILLLSGEAATQGATLWRTHLLKLGAAQVVNYQSIELSDQGLGMALQHATGVFMLEDNQASLLKALNANQGRLASLLIESTKRLPIGAAGNAVRDMGPKALYGTLGGPDYQIVDGLALLPSAVVEKNVWMPDAPERMLRTALLGGRAAAIGLAPDNAITVSGGQATVSGASQALVMDPLTAQGFQVAGDNSAAPSGVTGVTMSIVPPTGSYDLVKRQARM